MFGILHRMILWDLVKVFAMALIGITGLLLMAGIVAEASQQGLAPGQILEAIPLLVPSTLPYTIPATTLFACCVVYGRLAADNEILAIKAAGVNVLHVATPGLLLGLAMSGATMGLYLDVIPTSHLLLRQMIFNDAEELLYSMLRKRGVISHPQMPYAMWVREVQGRKLIDVTIKHRNAAGDTVGVIMAKQAELKVDMTRRKMLIRMKNASGSEDNSEIVFDEKPWELDLPPGFGPEAIRRPRDMTWVELFERRRGLARELEDLRLKIQLAGAPAPLVDAPPNLSQQVKQLETEEMYTKQQIIWIDVELLMRPSLSAGCFCFILVGCPVGIWFSRSDFLSSFITCFLPIVILYYPLMLAGTGMAKEGRIDPVLLVWGADLVMGAIGGVLFWRLLRN